MNQYKTSKNYGQKTVEINPKIKIVVMCFLKLNIDMHNDTDRQFFNLLDFIIILSQLETGGPLATG